MIKKVYLSRKEGVEYHKNFLAEEKCCPRNSKSNDAYLQFAIAVDFSEMFNFVI